MAIFKEKDIAGYYVDEEIVHDACATDQEKDNAEIGDIILQTDVEDGDRYFCDRCGKRIN